MTDCSCEIRHSCKSWLAEGRVFFRSTKRERKQEGDGKGEALNGRSSGACHILSHFGPEVYTTLAALLLPGSPTGSEKKKSHSRCLEAVRGTCSYKHTFLLVLTCISKPPDECVPGSRSDAHEHTKESVQTQTAEVTITSDAHHSSSAELQLVFCSWHVENSEKRLTVGSAERNVGLRSAS